MSQHSPPVVVPTAPPVPRVSTERVVNPDGTVTVGNTTYVPETVGTGYVGTDPGAKGEYSTKPNADGTKPQRVGEGDDGFNFMAGWLGTGDRQTELLQEHGNAGVAGKNLNWYDRNVLKITDETLLSAQRSSEKDILSVQYDSKLKAAGGAPVGWGESEPEVRRRLEELQTRDTRRTKARQNNASTESDAKGQATTANAQAGQTDFNNQFTTYTAQQQASERDYRRSQESIARQDRLSREREGRLDRLQQRADTKATQAQTLRLEQMRIDSDERRFNRQMERDAQKDRVAAIKGIANSFASLGAAFTL